MPNRRFGKLISLRGSLHIEELDEVKDAVEADEAKLKNKIHLPPLSLWFYHKEGTMGVAEALQPQPNLKSLSIYGYGDREWPNWMMVMSSLTKLKNLSLAACRACPCLPPLGRLPFLEELVISEVESVKYIGDEFLGLSSTIVFPKLKRLYFYEMGEWKQWEVKQWK